MFALSVGYRARWTYAAGDSKNSASRPLFDSSVLLSVIGRKSEDKTESPTAISEKIRHTRSGLLYYALDISLRETGTTCYQEHLIYLSDSNSFIQGRSVCATSVLFFLFLD